MSGQTLPDELWTRILEIGVRTSNFCFKDLCCISIFCRRLRRLSSDDSLWSLLLSSDFPHNDAASTPTAASKALYKIRFERDRQRKLMSHRRAVLRKESEVMEHSRKLRDMEDRLGKESERLKAASEELSNLRKVRQASVALNVWQPEVVRGRQKQVVEQCVVPVESRAHALEMEVRLCRQLIAGLNKVYKDEKHRLDKAKEQLASMKYHPLRDYASTSTTSGVEEQSHNKRKKVKRSNYSECCWKMMHNNAKLRERKVNHHEWAAAFDELTNNVLSMLSSGCSYLCQPQQMKCRTHFLRLHR